MAVKQKIAVPDLDEFIDLRERSGPTGFQPMRGRVSVAVYDHKRNGKTWQALTIRIADDLARKFGLMAGAKMSCLVHPDQQYLALRPATSRGAALFRPAHGTALTFQTTLKGGTLEAGPATSATMVKQGDTYIVALTPD